MTISFRAVAGGGQWCKVVANGEKRRKKKTVTTIKVAPKKNLQQ